MRSHWALERRLGIDFPFLSLPIARLSKTLPTLLLLRILLVTHRRCCSGLGCQYPDVEPVSPGGDSVAGRSAAACVGAERRGALGRGARRRPGGTAAAHRGGGGPGPRAPAPERGAGGEKRPSVKCAPRPRRPPRARLPRPPALSVLPAGGERGFLAAVAVAWRGSPEEAEESPPTTLSPRPARRRLGGAAVRPPV